MVALNQFSERGTTLVRSLQSVLHAIDEHKSQPEKEQIYGVLVAHVRSAMPMLLGTAPDTAPIQRIVDPPVRVDLADGSFYELSILERWLVLYVKDSAEHDADIKLTHGQATVLRELLADLIGGLQ